MTGLPPRVVRAARIGAVVLGSLLIGVGLLGHYVGIGSGGIGAIQLIAVLLGAGLAGLGIAGRRIPQLYRGTALVLLNTVVLILALELVSALILQVITDPSPPPVRSPWIRSPYYRNAPWAKQYVSEYQAMSARGIRYRPYVLYRWLPFEGQLLSLDEEGHRRTPGSVCREDAYTVLFFGGSTVWGLGSPDWSTIPAYLREELSRILNRPVCMRNLGLLGFVSTQSLIQLTLEVQAGRAPDLAIFYGGTNEIDAAVHFGEPEVHKDLARIAARIEAGEGEFEPRLTDLRWQSNFYRLLWRVMNPREQEPPPYPYHVSDTLARDVLTTYLENHRLAEALGRTYGFKVETFWQPMVIGDPKPLTPEEAVFRGPPPGQEGEVGPLYSFYGRVVSMVGSLLADRPHVHDLRSVFAGHPELIYIDAHHLTPEGNRIVALAIADALQRSGTLSEAPPSR